MSLRRLYKAPHGQKNILSEYNPDGNVRVKLDEKAAKKQFNKHVKQITHLQRLLYAQHKQKLLLIFQAMDTGGKDGTIRNVFNGVDPHGIRVISFKAPTQQELDRDYLWRIHQHVPAKGEIVIFNRSHYEDVVTVGARALQPQAVWEKRYDHINDFERMLTDEGCTILKFFLHISRDEQKMRLKSRLDTPKKHWKFEQADLEARELWNEYLHGYNEAIEKTSTSWAPWYVIPSNNKWFRNWLVSGIILETLTHLDLDYPELDFDPSMMEVH